jgi:hypothetical protein
MLLCSLSSSKRRAIAARLLVFVLGGLAMGVCCASAAAAPHAPKLVTTNPGSTETSPATSVTPSVLGEAEPEDGIIIESIRFGIHSVLAPVTRTVKNPTAHPGYEIQIFDGTECSGAPVATGTAEALEETGIAVGVTADAKTVLSARQIDPGNPGEPSSCSNALSYWEGDIPVEQPPSSGGGSTGGTSEGGSSSSQAGGGATSSGGAVGPATPVGGKPAAPSIHTSPSGRSNDLTPLIVGSAPGAASVAVFASSDCSGAAVAKGPATQLSSGFEVGVAENAATTFSAVAIGSQRSGCSSPVTYTEDSTAPRTRITMAPGVKTRKRKAVFRFKDVTEDPPGTAFVCKVDKARWKPCSSPFHVKHLKLGHYVVAIRATDLAGNVERKPVKRRFIVVPTAGP